MKISLRTVIQFLLNPRLLLCFGFAWMMTNGWSYIALVIGMWLNVSWLISLAGGYVALLWLPFTPEKLITVMIAMFLLRSFFPNDRQTLGILREMHTGLRERIRRRRENRAKKARHKDSDESE